MGGGDIIPLTSLPGNVGGETREFLENSSNSDEYYKNIEYVKEECKKLAKNLKELECDKKSETN